MNDLLQRAFDEQLSEADERALAEFLKTDDAAALRYLELARDEALLAEAVVEARAVRALEAPSRARWLVAAALLLAAVTLVLTPTPSAPPRPAAGTGLRAEYFDNPDLTQPRAARIDSFLDFEWTGGSPDPAVAPGSWSARWTGTLRPRTSGPHTFHLNADDGVRLWIGDRLLIDHWKEQTRTERAAATVLEAGVAVPIRLEYFNSNGPGALRLSWSGPSFPKEVVPPDVLTK